MSREARTSGLVMLAILMLGAPVVSQGRSAKETTVATDIAGREDVAILGGGCFWCIEAVYERIDGVKSAVSGYAGGGDPDPTYHEVSAGTTGHAEVVRIEFDPKVISYGEILDLFWRAHDPTTLNRQGADVGTQYRSVILYTSDAQKTEAERSKRAISDSGTYDNPIVTEILPLEEFFDAEEYHQDYYELNPNAGYCGFVIRPKLQKLGLDINPLPVDSD